jgi:Uri superfamily endonuclease
VTIAFVDAATAPREKGAYALLILLDAPLLVRAGRNAATLPPGRYIYCGSAKGPGGLAARLARHMRRENLAHWHVDQLTRAGKTLGAWAIPGGDECALNVELSALPMPVEGFGSSDCPRCESHLRLWPLGAALPSAWENARKGQD